jgi:hypothetical protein
MNSFFSHLSSPIVLYLFLSFLKKKRKIHKTKLKAYFVRKPILAVITDIADKINRKRTINIRRN